MSNIDAKHPDYDKMKDKWQLVDDAEASCYEKHVIPPVYPGRYTTARVSFRNANYIARAIFSNFVYNTLSVLVGTATYKEPNIVLPEALEYLRNDCTEDRLSINQFTRKSLRNVAAKGRWVMLTDFPVIDKGLTSEQIAKIDPKPHIRYYKAEDFGNWDYVNYNGGKKLSWACLREEVRRRVDGYKWACEYQYRILELDENGYYRFMLRNKDDKDLLEDWVYPRFNGQLIDYIPLDVVGAEDNNLEVDEPPMHPLAHINFGHLRNSASYEDNLDAHAQGTLFIASTLNASQWKEMTAVKPVMMGSREGHYIGAPGSTATLTQLQAGQELANAMSHKEQQLLAMGAFMFVSASSNAPVETTQMYMGSKNSPIVNYVKNYQQALYNQFVNCARFLNVAEEGININFPVDFIPKNADATVMGQLLAQQMAGIVSKRVLRDYDRNVDLLPEGMTDEDIDKDIAKENADPLGGVIIPIDNPNDPKPPEQGTKSIKEVDPSAV